MDEPEHSKVVGKADEPVGPPHSGVVLFEGMKPGAHWARAADPSVPDGQLAGAGEMLSVAVVE